MKQKLDLDILVANYNNGKFLETFFASIINSTMYPTKLIIVDDGSNDESKNIIIKYSNQLDFIHPIFLDKNVGFANALNIGIDYITSTYTLRIDPDDYLYKNRIEVQYNYIKKYNLDIVGSNINYFDSSTNKIICSSNVPINYEDIKKTFRKGSCGIIHGASIIKSEFLKKYKYCQESVPAEDYELFSKIIIDGGKVHNLEECLTAVRIHANSVSNSLPFNTIRKTFIIKDRIWGGHTSNIIIRMRHLHLKYYRSFLFEKNFIKKLYYIIISSLLAPQKVLKRIRR